MTGKLVLIIAAVCFIGLVESAYVRDWPVENWNTEYFQLFSYSSRSEVGMAKRLLENLVKVQDELKGRVPIVRYRNAQSLLAFSQLSKDKCTFNWLNDNEQKYYAYKKNGLLADYLYESFKEQFRFCMQNVWTRKEPEDKKLMDKIPFWDLQVGQYD